MTTTHPRIHRRLDSSTHGIHIRHRSLNFWQAFAVGGLLAYVVASPFLMIAIAQNKPDVAFLQSELTRAYGDSNRWQSQYAELAGQVDWVDDIAYRTGWRDFCLEFGYGDETDCTKWAEELER
jgi:hypothetical protein